MSPLLHLWIIRRLLNYSIITRPDTLDMMLQYFGADTSDAQQEIEDTRGCHIEFGFQDKVQRYHLDVVVKADDDDTHVVYRRVCALRLYLMYLVGTSIFVDKSVYYVNVVYLRYFIDLEMIHGYD